MVMRVMAMVMMLMMVMMIMSKMIMVVVMMRVILMVLMVKMVMMVMMVTSYDASFTERQRFFHRGQVTHLAFSWFKHFSHQNLVFHQVKMMYAIDNMADDVGYFDREV